MLIRIFLIALFFPAFVLVVRIQTVQFRALRVFLLFALMFATGYSIVFPETWQNIADLVGVGRGADLLLYLLAVSFITFVGLVIRKFRKLEHRIAILVQNLAIQKSKNFTNEETDRI